MKILFVCLGNICRSPMAEFIAKNYLKQHNISNIEISSAGIAAYHEGEFFHKGTKQILINKNIEFDPTFKSKPINAKIFNEFDYILVMDDSNYNDLIQMYGKNKKIRKIVEFSNFEYNEVPDPWYSGNFELVYKILDESISNFFKEILS